MKSSVCNTFKDWKLQRRQSQHHDNSLFSVCACCVNLDRGEMILLTAVSCNKLILKVTCICLCLPLSFLLPRSLIIFLSHHPFPRPWRNESATWSIFIFVGLGNGNLSVSVPNVLPPIFVQRSMLAVRSINHWRPKKHNGKGCELNCLIELS